MKLWRLDYCYQIHTKKSWPSHCLYIDLVLCWAHMIHYVTPNTNTHTHTHKYVGDHSRRRLTPFAINCWLAWFLYQVLSVQRVQRRVGLLHLFTLPFPDSSLLRFYVRSNAVQLRYNCRRIKWRSRPVRKFAKHLNGKMANRQKCNQSFTAWGHANCVQHGFSLICSIKTFVDFIGKLLNVWIYCRRKITTFNLSVQCNWACFRCSNELCRNYIKETHWLVHFC